MRLGALEAGGTKMVCAVCNEKGHVLSRVSIPTRMPQETFSEMVAYFLEEGVETLGIGCFGPIDMDLKSKTYGHILETPKLAWRGFPIVHSFQEALGLSYIGFDTDVNASLLGEATFGAAKDLEHALYITVGTGIGVGVMVNGKLYHGMRHAEAGHIIMSRKEGDTFAGCCPYHGSCFEGLASGPAVEKRWGKKGIELADQKEVWELEAYYIAQAIMTYSYVMSPQRIILGGGIMEQKQLLPLIKEELKHQLRGYMLPWKQEQNESVLDDYLVFPKLSGQQGIIGAAMLGHPAYRV